MTWQEAILARVRAAEARTFWEFAPQGTVRPYVTLLDVTSDRPQHLTGFDLEGSRVQIDVWADKYSDKNTIMDAVINALLSGATANGHTFQRAMVVLGPRDVAGERDGTAPVRRKSADLIIHHSTS